MSATSSESENPGGVTSSGHWQSISGSWSAVGSPLRPNPEDVAIFHDEVHTWTKIHGRPPRALILGVTPELFGLSWPNGSDLRAVDRSPKMIADVWPGPPNHAVRTDWLTLGSIFPHQHFDLILTDGGLHQLRFPDEISQLVEQLSQIMSPAGRFIFRLFAPPTLRENAEEVFAELSAGRIRDMNRLKLRLAMTTQESASTGASLSATYDRMIQHEPDLAKLGRRMGWTLAQATAIESYRGSSERFYFLSLPQAQEVLIAKGFSLVSQHFPSYPDGERFPIVTFARPG